MKVINVEAFMNMIRTAVAGTMESSDCMVTIEPGDNGIEFELDSSVIRQFGRQITKVTLETLERLEIKNARVKMVDKGALDCTIKARVECAVYRACGADAEDEMDWGGIIR